MLTRIPNVLRAEQVHAMRSALEAAGDAWVDGRVTAGHQGAPVKRNLQVDEHSQVARELGDFVLGALERNPLFITEPADYDGGELLIEDTHGAHSVKLPAGHLILYPADTRHRVTPVTGGA